MKDIDKRPTPLIIGWREHVGLPDFNIERPCAKIDNGARTSAFHATKIEFFTLDGGAWGRFLPAHSKTSDKPFAEVLVHDRRGIENISGIPERPQRCCPSGPVVHRQKVKRKKLQPEGTLL